MPYCQYDEEPVILKNLPESGRLLEVGAWNPITFSMSRALIEKGWSAVLVEPSPGPFLGFVKEYKDNPNITLVNALVGTGGFRMKKFYCTEDALSTTDVKATEKWGGVKNFREIIVCEAPMEHVATGNFDFVSIDTEGTSVDILKAIRPDTLMAKLICVEHDRRMNEINKEFAKRGFKIIHENGTNVIAKRV